MPTCIIGDTGFVGGNLLQQTVFDGRFNSRNIEEIHGKSYTLLICAGARAEKWKANQNPEEDRKNLDHLTKSLELVTVEKFILISTIDVYPVAVQVDEDAPIVSSDANAYGAHRRQLEQFVESHFDSLIVRLPGLFGNGLKKNIIYDFLHDNNLGQIHSESIYQFYNLRYLWRDIQIALNHNISLINFATEPTSVKEVVDRAFGREFNNAPPVKPAFYDMRTKYAEFYGGAGGYLYSKDEVLSEIRTFVGAVGNQRV